MKALKPKTGLPLKMADPMPSFEDWMKRVDTILERYRGISVHDLPDCRFRDWYDRRVYPIRAANRVLRAAGAFVD